MSKRVIDLTLDELVDAVVSKLESKIDSGTVNTDELAKILNCSTWQIGVYSRTGMYDAPGCRVKRNCWNPRACKEWVSTEYKKLVRMGQRRITKL